MEEGNDCIITAEQYLHCAANISDTTSASSQETLILEDTWNCWAEMSIDTGNDSDEYCKFSAQGNDQCLLFYWLDACEDYRTGYIHLFGRTWMPSVARFVSCCVTVKNVERRLYLLPRKTRFDLKTGVNTQESVVIRDVVREFDELISRKFSISTFNSRKVTRRYSFDMDDIPTEAEYLEIRYPASFESLPSNLRGETFSHVFGTNTTSLENFILETNLKGPGWLDIKLAQQCNPPISWCHMDIFVSKIGQVSVSSATLPPPSLVAMTITIQTMRNMNTRQDEVVGVTCLITTDFSIDKSTTKDSALFDKCFSDIGVPPGQVLPANFKEILQKQESLLVLDVHSSEKALLESFLNKLHAIGPDFIVGHDLLGTRLDLLSRRIIFNAVPESSRIGRLRHDRAPSLQVSVLTACGRIVVDVMASARELIRCQSYDLNELTNQVLQEKRTAMNDQHFQHSLCESDHLVRLIESGVVDAKYILRILCELNSVPLALQISNICGNLLRRTLNGGPLERIEYLLLHAFTEKNYIVPDSQYHRKTQSDVAQIANDNDDDEAISDGKTKSSYVGGLVLEPKKGLYHEFILLLDFNSLYPSIIQEFNICFTTIDIRQKSENHFEAQLPDVNIESGVIPTVVNKLVQRRVVAKRLKQAPGISNNELLQYDIRQRALKMLANSIYGCLGCSYSRFYGKPLASLITLKGREVLLKAKDLAQAMDLDVIYGDTDSVMIRTNCLNINDTMELGKKVRDEINKQYRVLKIDVDKIYSSLLLLGKKKYGGLCVEKVGHSASVTSRDVKGLEMIRRDWCPLAKQTGNYVLDQILSWNSLETIAESIDNKLVEVRQQVTNNELSLESYYIVKQLARNVDDYFNAAGLPHVQVAMRLNSSGLGQSLRQGDAIVYVICRDGSDSPYTRRAYHPDELRLRPQLHIDTDYYLSHQVHPLISRLCAHLPTTNSAHIAKCLDIGLIEGHKPAIVQKPVSMGLSVEHSNKLEDWEFFSFNCVDCRQENVINGPTITVKGTIEWSLLKCTNRCCVSVPLENSSYLQNLVTLAIRAKLQQYHENWLKCTKCNLTTRRLPLIFNDTLPACPKCERRGTMQSMFTDRKLYRQLQFYLRLFDVSGALANTGCEEKRDQIESCLTARHKDCCLQIKNNVDKILKKSAFSEVDLGNVFEQFNVEWTNKQS